MTSARPDATTLDSAGRAIWLRRDAEKIAGSLPPLLAEAKNLSQIVGAGLHGRRKAGQGENFWQFRHALPGDSAAAIDWRRSARSDSVFIRELEWESAQTVSIWVDNAHAMDYRGANSRHSKGERGRLLALSLSVLLSAAGERTMVLGTTGRAGTGERHLQRMAMDLSAVPDNKADVGFAPRDPLRRGSKAVFISDFLGPQHDLTDILVNAADNGVRGCLLQILDESEEAFPFDGRTIFESMAGAVDFETFRASSLRTAYQNRLAERRDMLADTCRKTGWRFLTHRTSESPRKALLWLYVGIGEAI